MKVAHLYINKQRAIELPFEHSRRSFPLLSRRPSLRTSYPKLPLCLSNSKAACCFFTMLRLLVSLVATISIGSSLASGSPSPASDHLARTPVGAQAPLFASQVNYPSFLKFVDSLSPNFEAPNVIPFSRSPSLVHYSGTGESPTFRFDSLLKFTNIPSDAHLCELKWAFPDGWHIEVGGIETLDVYKVDREAEDTDSWANSPQEAGLFGTTTLKPGTKGFVNSAVCNGSMTFRIEISRDTGSMGHVSFAQSNGPSHWGQPAAGWYLTYEV